MQPHEARIADDIHTRILERRGHGRIERLAALVSLVIDDRRRDPGRLARLSPSASALFETASTISAGKSASLAASMSETRLVPRPEISAPTRLRPSWHYRAGRSNQRPAGAARFYHAYWENAVALGLEELVVGGASLGEATATTPTPQLNARSISAFQEQTRGCKPFENR